MGFPKALIFDCSVCMLMNDLEEEVHEEFPDSATPSSSGENDTLMEVQFSLKKNILDTE